MPIIAGRASAAYGAGFAATIPVAPYAGPFGAYDALAITTVPSGGVSLVTFAGIPTGYKHLQIRSIGQDDRATYGISELAWQFNDDTGSNYSFHGLYGNGSSVVSEPSASTAFIRCNGVLGSTTGGTFGAFVIDILDYADTSKNTTTRTLCGVDFNGEIASFGGRAALWSGAWYNTSAVNSIDLYSTNGNLQQHTTFALYGVK
jgi:hypothetical protein